jgi:hypothetical protein
VHENVIMKPIILYNKECNKKYRIGSESNLQIQFPDLQRFATAMVCRKNALDKWKNEY